MHNRGVHGTNKHNGLHSRSATSDAQVKGVGTVVLRRSMR